MRMQISLPPLLAQHLRDLATNEHRFPKQQAEILLYKAIELAIRERDAAGEPPLEEMAHASAE